jgi:hypothetical protein
MVFCCRQVLLVVFVLQWHGDLLSAGAFVAGAHIFVYLHYNKVLVLDYIKMLFLFFLRSKRCLSCPLGTGVLDI